MRIAFVSIPRFPCAVEVQRQPSLAGRALIVGDAEQPKRVLDCSAEAGGQGVRSGMPVRQALSHCPDAVILPPDPVLYQSKWEAVLEALAGISPEVEDDEQGRAYVNVRGLAAHYRDDDALAAAIVETVLTASGLEARVGLANGKFAALAAATCCRSRESLERSRSDFAEQKCRGSGGAAHARGALGGVPPDPISNDNSGAARERCAAATRYKCDAVVVQPGEEAAFLAPLDIDLLPVEPAVIFRMRILGLDRIGDVARLTVPELQSQFGFEGKRLWQLANGLDDEPLRPRKRTEALQAGVSLESSVAGIDVMIAIARQLLSRLRLSLQGRAARELTLQAELESGRGWQHHLVFREPVSEDERLSFLLRSALTNFPPPQAIRSLSLRLSSLTGETGKQLSLGNRSRRQRQLEEVIRQLKTRYGYSPVYRCVDVEPWSVIPEERQILVESDA